MFLAFTFCFCIQVHKPEDFLKSVAKTSKKEPESKTSDIPLPSTPQQQALNSVRQSPFSYMGVVDRSPETDQILHSAAVMPKPDLFEGGKRLTPQTQACSSGDADKYMPTNVPQPHASWSARFKSSPSPPIALPPPRNKVRPTSIAPHLRQAWTAVPSPKAKVGRNKVKVR